LADHGAALTFCQRICVGSIDTVAAVVGLGVVRVFGAVGEAGLSAVQYRDFSRIEYCLLLGISMQAMALQVMVCICGWYGQQTNTECGSGWCNCLWLIVAGNG
jgi:hypothetical protein